MWQRRGLWSWGMWASRPACRTTRHEPQCVPYKVSVHHCKVADWDCFHLREMKEVHPWQLIKMQSVGMGRLQRTIQYFHVVIHSSQHMHTQGGSATLMYSACFHKANENTHNLVTFPVNLRNESWICRRRVINIITDVHTKYKEDGNRKHKSRIPQLKTWKSLIIR